MAPTPVRILLVAAIGAVCAIAPNCASRLAPPKPTGEGGQTRAQTDAGIPVCPDSAAKDLLSSDALQCWFTAPHGQWRTLNHQSHLEALVVEVEARDLRDAVEIAQHVVEDPMARAFSEILVYVARMQGRESRVRRVRWTRSTGFDTLDFSSPVADTPLTVRSSPDNKPID